jgi:hypothetical protein
LNSCARAQRESAKSWQDAENKRVKIERSWRGMGKSAHGVERTEVAVAATFMGDCPAAAPDEFGMERAASMKRADGSPSAELGRTESTADIRHYNTDVNYVPYICNVPRE